jgi:hypothetical protein
MLLWVLQQTSLQTTVQFSLYCDIFLEIVIVNTVSRCNFETYILW